MSTIVSFLPTSWASNDTDAPAAMDVMKEETFGPIIGIMKACSYRDLE